MKLPIEWIREYVDLDVSAEELAERLTMAGLEVEETAESSLGPVLDIKVTPNRGDCLSVVGVTREIAAAYGLAVKPLRLTPSEVTGGAGNLTSVLILDPDLCPRYAARIIRNIKQGESPGWMQERLTAAGMRPVSNIVDVTNYVMLETGQPLHAFDFDKLVEQRIVVRAASAGERMTTLDGQQRELVPGMLLICDGKRPVAIAGVMGGEDTEMGDGTRNVLLESAHFDPISIRRTAKALGMRTEASYRFERSVDPGGVVAAADRACALIAELGMGEVVPAVVDEYPGAGVQRTIGLRPERVSMLLGFEVSAEEAADSLGRLGFELNEAAGAIAVTVPSWRPDIVREEDLVEEVGRVLGYERIPERLPRGSSVGRDTEESRFAGRIRAMLAGLGLQEIVAHSLLAPGPHEDARTDSARVGIRSALSAELSGLRRSLLPGLLDALSRNARRGQSPLAFFEVGNVFHRDGDRFVEMTAVGGLIAGSLRTASWRQDSRPADYYTARGIVDGLADGLRYDPSEDGRLHPGRSANVILDGKKVGWVGELHPSLTEGTRVKDRLVAFELAMEPIRQSIEARSAFRSLSPFPAVVRDLAPRIAGELPYAEVEKAVESAGVALVEKVDLTDTFAGPPLPDGLKSLTLSFTFRAADHTLTDEEVNAAVSQIRSALETGCGAQFP